MLGALFLDIKGAFPKCDTGAAGAQHVLQRSSQEVYRMDQEEGGKQKHNYGVMI